MLKELFELVQGNAGDVLRNNTDVPVDKNSEVVAEATNTVASGLRNMVAGGGVQSILDLFKSNGDNKNGLLGNPVVSMMIGHFAGKLISKHNMNGEKANGIAASLIPGVLASLINKSNDSSDNRFSLDNLLASITGGKSAEITSERGGSITDILSQLGNDQPAQSNGGGNWMDIIGQLAGGAQQQQQRNGGGGLLDLIKGFMR